MGVLPFASVAFTLKVTEGPGEGEAFTFDGGEARLGRTADNDVVIKDPSSSRSHARVYEEDGQCFVEDLKSANGTQVNGKGIKAPRPLASGDRIIIGDVVLHFEVPEAASGPSSTLDDGADEVDAKDTGERTVLKPPSLKGNRPAPPRRSLPREKPAPEPEPDEPEDEAPGEPDEAVEGDDDAGANHESPGGRTKDFEVPPPRALQRRTASSAGAPLRAPRPAAALAGAEDGLSAADRARQRRELQKSAAGRAQLLWTDLSKPARLGLGLFGLVLGVGLVGGAASSLVPRREVKKNEPVALRANGEPIRETFGAGEVDYFRPDLKSFTFEYQSPTTIVGVLHYQARDISKDEVSVELNGTALGVVPPDTVDVATRQLELVLPAAALKLDEPNELTFDNVNNPPGEDPWAIWNVWVEIIPVPRMSAEEAANRSKQDMERAQKQYEMKQVGAMNLFRAWKGYRDAWLLLEATPDRPADLLQMSLARMREIRPELDRKCSAMLVDYQKAMNMKRPDLLAARSVLTNIGDHFEKEHPCFIISRGMLRELDALDGPGE